MRFVKKFTQSDFWARNLYTLKVRKLRPFLLTMKQRKCIDISISSIFLLEMNWVCKNFHSLSVKSHLLSVNLVLLCKFSRMRIFFRNNLHSWHKFYTTAGHNKSQLYLFGKLQEQIHATTSCNWATKIDKIGQWLTKCNAPDPKRINWPSHTLAGYAAYCMQGHVTRQEGLKSQKFLI